MICGTERRGRARARRIRTLSHVFSSFVSMPSSTMRVEMGTQVRRSKPSQIGPLNSRFVCTCRTTSADSMRTPHWFGLSERARAGAGAR